MRRDRAGALKSGERSSPPSGQKDGAAKGQGKDTRRLTVAELKLVSHCANCGQQGHWKADRKNAYKPREARSTSAAIGSQVAAASPSHFSFAAELPGQTGLMSWLSRLQVELVKKTVHLRRLEQEKQSAGTWLSLGGGMAIVDTGAAQDLIGLSAYRALVSTWKKKGLQPVRLSKKPRATAGIGGQAKALFMTLMPVAFKNKLGVVEMTVLDEDIPHLLSAPFLTYLQAHIDMAGNNMVLQHLQVQVS